MNDNYGYLERGTLIQEGTMLKVWNKADNGELILNGLYIVTELKKISWMEYETFSVQVDPVKIEGAPDESYSQSDLEDLLNGKQLVIYNKS